MFRIFFKRIGPLHSSLTYYKPNLKQPAIDIILVLDSDLWRVVLIMGNYETTRLGFFFFNPSLLVEPPKLSSQT